MLTLADGPCRAPVLGRSCFPRRYRSRGLAAGFTVIELVVVIVILGIIVAVAVPRFFDDRSFLERGYSAELAAALRYA